MFLVNHNRKFVIKVTAKVASSTLKKIFLNTILFDDRNNKKINDLYKKYTADNVEKVLIDYVITKEQVIELQGKGYKFFHFCRDPYRRCVSGFLNLFLDNEKSIARKLSNWRYRLHVNAVYQDVWEKKNYSVNSSITFSDFVAFLERNNDVSKLDTHWQPQSFSISNLNPDYIIKIENLDKDLHSFFTHIGINKESLIVNRQNVTKYKEKVLNKNLQYHNLIGEELLKLDLPNYKYFLKDGIQEKIYWIYEEDFILFNYPYKINY